MITRYSVSCVNVNELLYNQSYLYYFQMDNSSLPQLRRRWLPPLLGAWRLPAPQLGATTTSSTTWGKTASCSTAWARRLPAPRLDYDFFHCLGQDGFLLHGLGQLRLPPRLGARRLPVPRLGQDGFLLHGLTTTSSTAWGKTTSCSTAWPRLHPRLGARRLPAPRLGATTTSSTAWGKMASCSTAWGDYDFLHGLGQDGFLLHGLGKTTWQRAPQGRLHLKLAGDNLSLLFDDRWLCLGATNGFSPRQGRWLDSVLLKDDFTWG